MYSVVHVIVPINRDVPRGTSVASDVAIPYKAASAGNDGRECFARALLLLTFCGASVPRYARLRRATREPDAVKGNRLSSRDRASGIVSRHGCRTSSQFLFPNYYVTALIIRGDSHGSQPTIDMSWSVILNPDSRDEESLTSGAALKEILLPTRRDRHDRFGLMSLS